MTRRVYDRCVDPREPEILRLLDRYLVEIVEAYDLCPWARAARTGGELATAVLLGAPDPEAFAAGARGRNAAGVGRPAAGGGGTAPGDPRTRAGVGGMSFGDGPCGAGMRATVVGWVAPRVGARGWRGLAPPAAFEPMKNLWCAVI